MNDVFNQNFMLGFLMAKDRPREEAISAGLQLSQAPANNAVSVVLIKKQVDKVVELETANKRLSDENATLQENIRVLKQGKPAEGEVRGGANDNLEQQIKALLEAYQVPDAVAAANKDKVKDSVVNLGEQILAVVKNG